VAEGESLFSRGWRWGLIGTGLGGAGLAVAGVRMMSHSVAASDAEAGGAFLAAIGTWPLGFAAACVIGAVVERWWQSRAPFAALLLPGGSGPSAEELAARRSPRLTRHQQHDRVMAQAKPSLEGLPDVLWPRVLEPMLRDARVEVRLAALDYTGLARRLLVALAGNDEDDLVRWRAWHRLGPTLDRSICERLLRSSHEDVRVRAVRAGLLSRRRLERLDALDLNSRVADEARAMLKAQGERWRP